MNLKNIFSEKGILEIQKGITQNGLFCLYIGLSTD